MGVITYLGRMIRKGFTDEVMSVIGLEETMDKMVLVVGATPTAWGRFGSGLVYQGKGNLLGCYIGFIQEVQSLQFCGIYLKIFTTFQGQEQNYSIQFSHRKQ